MSIATLSRRQFLRVTAGVAAGGVLAACAMPTAPASGGTEAAIEISFARHGNELLKQQKTSSPACSRKPIPALSLIDRYPLE